MMIEPGRPVPFASFAALLGALLVAASCTVGDDPAPAGPGLGVPDPAFPDGSSGSPAPSPTASPDPTASPVAQEIRFVALGDTGKGSAQQYAVAEGIRRKCEADGCDFGVLLGDNVYPSGVTSADDPQWEPKVAGAYRPLGIPFYAVLGNHDYGGGSGANPALGAHQVEYSRQNEWFVMPDEWYAFDEGPATFLATGTNPVYRNDTASRAAQTAFFRDAIDGSSRPWKISLGHHPYISNGPHGNAGDYDGSTGRGANVKAFFEEALCGGVDLHLTGHDHSLQVLPGPASCPGTFVVSGNGAYPSSLTGSNPVHFQSLALGFAYLTVSESAIVVEMVDSNGQTLFSRTVTK